MCSNYGRLKKRITPNEQIIRGVMKNNYSRASLSELQNVFKMLSSGKGVREISRILGRSPSTISKWKNKYKPKKRKLWFRLCTYGKAKYVHDRLSNQKRELRKKIPIRDVKTRDYVISQLIDRCSPEQISETMEEEIGTKAVSYTHLTLPTILLV